MNFSLDFIISEILQLRNMKEFWKQVRTLCQENLPARLFEIPQPPKRLFAVGDTSFLTLPLAREYPASPDSLRFLCVVGARRCTPYGKEVCQALISGLRGLPVVIVSGLAIGIDGIAHEAALDAGLRTIAFPGSSLHPRSLYPATNFRLAERIVENGGCLISEFEEPARGMKYFFHQRNRLMAGISHAVLIIEAELGSGSLITGNLGLEYNRDILIVPGSILSSLSKGPLSYMCEGATPITCPEDLREALGFERDTAASGSDQLDLEAASAEDKLLLKLLKTPRNRAELVELSGLPAGKASSAIALLEIQGRIRESGGQLRLA